MVDMVKLEVPLGGTAGASPVNTEDLVVLQTPEINQGE
jgi:hypothetical protein